MPSSSLWSSLPSPARWLLGATILDFLGAGLVMPFGVIYLHEVRHIPLPTVGLLIALSSLVAVLVMGPAGSLMDRYGVRRLVIGAFAVQVAAELLMAVAVNVWIAGLSSVLLGISSGFIWPGLQTLIRALLPSEQRQRYFGLNFTILNLGIGVGGIISGLFVDVNRPATFVSIYLINALSFLVPMLVLMTKLRGVDGRPEHEGDEAPPTTSTYLDVLRSPAMRRVVALSALAGFVGYAQMASGLPAFARADSRVGTDVLGWLYAANTAVIVLTQLPVLSRIDGRRRTRALAGMAVLWALSWLLLGLSAWWPGTLVAAALVLATGAVFGLGETLYQPTLPAIVNDLAPAAAAARYNAASSMAFQLSNLVAPVAATWLIDHSWATAYIVMLVAGCGLVGVLALRLERLISPATNGVRTSTDLPAATSA